MTYSDGSRPLPSEAMPPKPDVDLVDPGDGQDLVHVFDSLAGLQKEHGADSAVYELEEGADLLRGFEVGQHDDVRPGRDGPVDLHGGAGVIRQRVMDRVDARKDLSHLHGLLDVGDIQEGVPGFDRVKSLLPFILTDELHVYEDSIYAGGLRDLRDVGPVGNIHQFQHGISLLSRELQG